MESLTVSPIDAPNAVVRVPGSRSITNRALVCAALADGESRIRNWLDAQDTEVMRNGLRALGVVIAKEAASEELVVRGTGGELKPNRNRIDCGASGTTMRFLTATATLATRPVVLVGSKRLHERPIGALVRALRGLGASVEDTSGFPPVRVAPSVLEGFDARIDARESGQFVSALLLLGPSLQRGLSLTVTGSVSKPFIAMTIQTMRQFGVEVKQDGDHFQISSRSPYKPAQYSVEPDAMSASYFFAAAAILGGTVTVSGLHRDSIQGDIAFVDVLEQMGCTVSHPAQGMRVQRSGELRGIDVNLNAMPDMAPTLAVVACFASTPTTMTGIAHLRLKESDRLDALRNELAKLGATVTVGAASLRIEPPTQVSPGPIETYDDHRIAMSFALAGLKVPGISIQDPQCVAKTYPHFFDDLEQLRPR